MTIRKEKPLDPSAVAVASEAMPDPGGQLRIDTNAEILCSPVRVKILRALATSELAAGDLALVIERSRSATSQHLKVLRDAGIVIATRTGNVVRYKLNEGLAAEVLAQVALKLDAA